MNFKNTVITVVLAGFVTLPALAANKQTFTCERSTDANGNVIYLPVKKVAKVTHHRHRVAVARPQRVYREETKVVNSAPEVAVVETETYSRPVITPSPERREAVRQEIRRSWMARHTPKFPIYGNMSGWAGTSMISALHGTDNPYNIQALNNDIGPSANFYKNTATENSREEF